MSEPDSTSPSSVPVSGSSSSGPTAKAGNSRKATKPWPPVVGRVAYVVGVVIVLWVAAFTIPMNNHFLYGGATGATAMMLVYAALFVAKRRGYDTFFIREFERREDERDRAALRRAWSLVGVVGFVGNLVVVTVGAFGGQVMPFLGVVMWLQVIGLLGGNIYFNRTM